MAKTPKLKKREPSLHSRASRRQTGPQPSDLKTKASAADTDQATWMYHTQNAGITKKKKSKQLTRQQRLRQQKGLENAERNIDKLEKKVKDSKQKGKKVRERRAEWEELNGDVLETADGEAEQGPKDLPRENWTDKMVDVELKEAMEEIQGFELPRLGGDVQPTPAISNAMDDKAPAEGEKPVTKDVDTVDNIS